MADFTVGDYDYTIVSGTTNVSMKVHDTSKTSYATPTGTVTYDGVTYTVTDMYRCFYNCKSLVTAPSLSAMTSVTRMQQCFYYCTAMTSGPNLSGMVSVTNMTDCFEYCKAMTTPPNLSGMSSVTDMSGCFALCTVMSSPPDLSSMTQVTKLFQCFSDCNSLASPPDISHMTLVTDMHDCFKNCKAMTSPPNLSNLTLVTRMDSCFEKCTSLTVPPDMSAMTVLTRMDDCFYGCSALASPPDVSNSTLMTNMSQAFHSCTSLTSPPDLSNMTLVTDMSLCFYGCTALKVAPNMSAMTGLKDATSCFRNCTSIGGFVNIGTTYTGSYPALSVNYLFDGTSRTLILIVPPSMRSSWEARTLPSNVSLIGLSVSNVSVNIGDYQYKYYTDSEGTLTSLSAKVIDTTKTSYEPICPLVTKLDECFYGCNSMTAPPSMHGMTLVTNMYECFRGCTSMSSSPDLSSMSGLESMNYCFYGCSSMVSPPNLSGISSVELMGSCFYGCTSMTSPPDMSSMTEVIDMYECFFNCSSMTSPPDLSGLGPYVSIHYCFYNCSSMTSPPDMSGLTETRNLQRCFYGCSAMTLPPDISQMVLVDTMSYCFYNCSSMSTPPDLSNMTRVTSIEGCFSGCSSMSTPPDISGMTQLLNMNNCFQNCTAMPYVPDLSNLESVTSMASCFTMCTSITSPPDLSNMSLVTNMYRCFSGCSAMSSPPDLSDMALVENMSYCFNGCSSLTTPPDLSGMTAITNMSYCFAGCSVMTSAPNLSGMSSVTNMSYCFADCTALTSGPNMSGMSSVTDISYCFSDCTALTSGPNMSGMSSVTNMSHAFYQCSSMVLPPNLSGVSSVTDMSYCFYRCYRMASPPDMRFMSKVTNMESCFFYCSSLTSPPDMSGMVSVTNMSHCFDYCTALASPPDMLNMTKVTNMYMCFRYCESLTTPPDLSNMTLLTNMDECFGGCHKMLGFLAIGTTTPPNNLGMYILEGVGMGTGSQGTVLDSNSPGFLHNYLVVIVPSSQRSNWSSYIGAMPHVKLVAASVTNSVLYLGWNYRSLSSSSMPDNIGKAEDVSVYRYVYSTNSSGQLTELSCYALGAPYSGSTFYSFPQIDMNTTTMSNCFDMTYHGTLFGNQKPYVDTYGKQSTGLYYPHMIPPKVTNLYYSFCGCSGMEIPPLMTSVVKVTTLQYCFSGCVSLKFGPTIGSVGAAWTAIPDMTSCFSGCLSMEKFGYPYEMDSEVLTPVMTTNASYCFYECESLETAPSILLVPDTGRNVSVASSALYLTFGSCIKLEEIAPYEQGSYGGIFGLENVSSMDLAFSSCRAMKEPPRFYGGYTVNSNTSIHVTTMRQCFQYCSSLESAPDLSKFDSLQDLAYCYRNCFSLALTPEFSDASKETITNIAYCFYACVALTRVADTSGFTSLTNMSYCYMACSGLRTLQWDETVLYYSASNPGEEDIYLSEVHGLTALPSNSAGVLRGCSSLTSIPKLIVADCQDMSEAFYDCVALENPPVLEFTNRAAVSGQALYGNAGPRVTNMSYAFYRCTSMTSAPSLEGVSSVTNMDHCFYGCEAMLTPPNMDGMTALANMSNCFAMCSSMMSLPDVSDSTSVSNMSYCFDGCESATGDLAVGSKLVTSYEGLFRDTEEDIWIIPTVSADRTHSADSVSTTGDHWYYVVYRDIPESLKDHVHIYSPGVNPLPTCTVDFTRFERPEDFIENQAGTWILFKVLNLETYTVTVKEKPKLKTLKAYIVDVDDLQSVAYLKEAEDVVSSPGSFYQSIDLTYVCPDRTSPRYANDLSSFNVYNKLPSDVPNDAVYMFTQQDTTSKFVVFHLVDSYENVKLVFVTVPKAFATFSFYKPGTGVGVGIPAHRNGLDVDMQGYFYNNIGIKDFATLPVVVCHDSQPDPNANYPDPCIVLCVDPTYVWAAITGMSLSSSFGIKPYLVGDNLPMTAENDDKVFVTSEPYLVGSTPTDSWKVVSNIIGAGSKVTKFPVDNVLSKSAGSYTIADTDAGKQLIVSVFGKDELTLTFQNGNDYDQLHGVHFEVYGMNVKDLANAEPVYSSTEDPEYNRVNTETSWNANANPSSEGWYEKETLLVTQGGQGGSNERYVLSEDTNVVVGKDYYTQGQRKYTMKGIDGKLGFFYIDAVEDSDYYTPNATFDYHTTSSVTF